MQNAGQLKVFTKTSQAIRLLVFFAILRARKADCAEYANGMKIKLSAAATKTSADGLPQNSRTEASVGQRARGKILIQRASKNTTEVF